MAGLFGVSFDRKICPFRFPNDLYWGTFYHQHLGEKYAGISFICTKDGEKVIDIRTAKGHFRPNFDETKDIPPNYTAGIGYCGLVSEPLRIHTRLGQMSLCFSGNIMNRWELIRRFEKSGHIFEKGKASDIEIIALLLVQGEGDIVEGIRNVAKQIEGAFILLILAHEGVYAVRGPNGHWPLAIGKKPGAVAVASDCSGFCNLNLSLIRELGPGEVVLLKDGEVKELKDKDGKDIALTGKLNICSFYPFYTAFATGTFAKISVALIRKRGCAALARQDMAKGFIPDIVVPVPDSGRLHAIGYWQEFYNQFFLGNIKKMPVYDELLAKFAYAGRSFTPEDPEERYLEAYFKILVCLECAFREDLMLPPLLPLLRPEVLAEYQENGEEIVINIVLVDDSIVRGTQASKNLIPKLESMASKISAILTEKWKVKIICRIHLRLAYPALFSHCRWGKTTKKGECLATQIPDISERARHLGAVSIRHNTIDDMVAAIGLPRDILCLDCALPAKD